MYRMESSRLHSREPVRVRVLLAPITVVVVAVVVVIASAVSLVGPVVALLLLIDVVGHPVCRAVLLKGLLGLDLASSNLVSL